MQYKENFLEGKNDREYSVFLFRCCAWFYRLCVVGGGLMEEEKNPSTLRKKDYRETLHRLWLQFQLVKKKSGMEYDKQLDRYLEGLK